MEKTYQKIVEGIKILEGKHEVSDEIAEGIIIDYNEEGQIISIEILNASERLPKDNLRNILVKLPQTA